VIVTRQLTKRYGHVLAVDQVSVHVRGGDRYGLLGPNGSGKTTLVRLVLGLVFATAGEIELMGRPVPRRLAQVLPQVGAIVEGVCAYEHLSGRANLRLLDAAGPRGSRRTRRARLESALERVGLGAVDRRPVRAYSLGMRQRLGLAAALMRPPRLLILDEPTNGLDPQGIRDVRELLVELNAAGTTILMSSHILSEVDSLCTRVGVMDRGRLVLESTMEDLRKPTGRIRVTTPDAERAVALLDGQVDESTTQRLTVRATDPAALNARLVGAGVRVAGLEVERTSLEDVILAATGVGSDRLDRLAGPGLTGPGFTTPTERIDP
jgi:ABC-2 type transport system ATP-binding protein